VLKVFSFESAAFLQTIDLTELMDFQPPITGITAAGILWNPKIDFLVIRFNLNNGCKDESYFTILSLPTFEEVTYIDHPRFFQYFSGYVQDESG
jgi:hypothetical protein